MTPAILAGAALLVSGSTANGVSPDAPPATPAPAPSTQVLPVEPLKAAALLMDSGHLDDAAKLLDAIEKTDPDNPQMHFLFALLAMERKDYVSAIRRLRRILADEPTNVRVRLELGRTYFLKGDYQNADRQFRFARAGNLPPAVNANVELYLRQIRLLKRFSYGFSIAIAPDTNLNAGPAIDSVSLYGIPFQLDDSAKRKSGVGLAVQGEAEWTFKIAPKVRVRTGAQISRSQYRQSDFNDMTAIAYAGPRLSLKRWDFDAALIGQRRWYGDRPYMEGYGGRMAVTHYISGKTALFSSASLLHQSYPRNTYQNGMLGSISAGFAHIPTASSVVQGGITYARQDARLAAFANRSGQLNLSYTREFRGGLTLAVAPSIAVIDYDARLQAFDRVRRDRQVSISTSILNRRIDFFGLTPRLIYTYTANFSNIDLYSLRRNRFEIGVARLF